MEKKHHVCTPSNKWTNKNLIYGLTLAIMVLMILLPLLYFALENLGIHTETAGLSATDENGWQIPGIVFLALIGYILLSTRRSI